MTETTEQTGPDPAATFTELYGVNPTAYGRHPDG